MGSKKKKRADGNPTINTRGKRPKCQKGEEGKGGTNAAKFACLDMGECDPSIEEIQGNGVNVATGRINLPDALFADDWGSKNWDGGRSSIIDTRFKGGGMRSFANVCWKLKEFPP